MPDEKDFYSNLNLEKVTNAEYMHVKKYRTTLKWKTLVTIIIYTFIRWFIRFILSNLYVYTLLLADILESFRNKCIEILELDLTHFLSPPGLACQICLKNTRVELELLIDIDEILMVEKRIRGGICYKINIHQYTSICNSKQ